jgi:hypothetical protein
MNDCTPKCCKTHFSGCKSISVRVGTESCLHVCMRKSLLLPLSAVLAMLPLMTAFAQSVSSSSSSSSSSVGLSSSSMSSSSWMSSLSSWMSSSSMMSSMSSRSLSSSSRSSSSSSRWSSSSNSLSSLHPIYDTTNIGRYTDTAGWDQPTSVAISALTSAGILQGDPTGTFRANSTLNRAEFMKIVMSLLPPSDNKEFLNCFPDVTSGAWYEAAVCRAKSLGIVRGNVDTNVTPDKWMFQPDRPVQYEEAVKVLDKVYAYSVIETNGDDWYVPFINEAHKRGIDLNGLAVGDKITRGEMARLTANFLAYSQGDFDLLQAAQNRSSMSSRSSSSRSTSSWSSRSSQSSWSSSARSGTYDTLTDSTVQSNFTLLGQTSPVIAGAKFFSNNEPMMVNSLQISLNAPVSSINAFLVYDQDGRYLGTATQQGTNGVYTVTFPTGTLDLPQRQDHSVYLRARLNDYNSGGVSGQPLQIATVQITGTGDWSNDTYSSSSSDVFPAFSTARAAITSVTNAGQASALLTGGQDQLLANFAFATTSTDSQAHVMLQQLRMQVQATAGVTLSNVMLRQEGSDTSVPCTVSSSVVTCSSIPATFGTITGTENFLVYGDVNVPSNANNPSLSLTINEPGTPSTAGDITWSDGTSSFTWIMGNAPVVRGTQFQ